MHGDRSKELIWTPTSEQQFRKLLHFACRRSQLPAETQLLYRCCFSAPFHCKAPVERGEVRALSQPDPRLSLVLALSNCSNGFEDLLPPSCMPLAPSRGVLAWPHLATLRACQTCSHVGDSTGTWRLSLSQHMGCWGHLHNFLSLHSYVVYNEQ